MNRIAPVEFLQEGAIGFWGSVESLGSTEGLVCVGAWFYISENWKLGSRFSPSFTVARQQVHPSIYCLKEAW